MAILLKKTMDTTWFLSKFQWHSSQSYEKILKIIWEHRRCHVTEATLSRKSNAWDNGILGLKLYYRAIITNTMTLAPKQTYGQYNRIVDPKIDSCCYNHWIFNNVKTYRKDSLVLQMVLGILDIHIQTNATKSIYYSAQKLVQNG